MPGGERESSAEGQFFAIPKDVAYRDDISVEAKFLYGILFTRANGDNMAWPGQENMAKAVRCSVRSVQRYIDELVGVGLITKKRGGMHQTNRYVLQTRQNVASSDDTGVASSGDTGVVHNIGLKRKDVKEQDCLYNCDGKKPKARKDADIMSVFQAFIDTGLNRTPGFANRTQRTACRDLATAYGVEGAVTLVGIAARATEAKRNGDRFAPSATTPLELTQKVAKLETWDRGRQTERLPDVEEVRRMTAQQYAE